MNFAGAKMRQKHRLFALVQPPDYQHLTFKKAKVYNMESPGIHNKQPRQDKLAGVSYKSIAMK